MAASKLTKKELADLERLAGLGLTQAQIADWFGFSERTLARRLQDDSAVAAYKKGRAKALEKVSSSLWELIEAGDKASIFFYLKCQAGWREKVSAEENMTPQEFARMASAAMDAMRDKLVSDPDDA